MWNKITTILRLVWNVISRRKKFTLRFIKESGRWYYDFKNWGFEKGNLEMVAGADKLCEKYSAGDEAIVKIIASKKKQKVGDEWKEYTGEDLSKFSFTDRLLYGREYQGKDDKFWICPVTLFVLGRYPNYLYIQSGS